MARARPLLVTDLDGRAHPGAAHRPWSQLVALLGLVVLIDLVIAMVRPSATETPLADTLPQARQALARANDQDESWLLLGDSVLAGDVMQDEIPRWAEHRVLDYLRREQDVRSEVGFEQIALDGMLPVDLLHVVRELDGIDPSGHVGVVLEINPRFFSRHYVKQRACTRGFLCELGPALGKPKRWGWVRVAWEESERWLLDHLPVVRHRELFPKWGATPQAELVAPLQSDATPSQEGLIGEARVLEHYRNLVIDERSIQYRALGHLVRRLRERGRPALLFATPLNDGMLRDTLDGEAYGAYVARLDRYLNRIGDTSVRFVSLDHPSLPDDQFLDHAHLRPEGNRWLARNLLHLLGVDMSIVPPRGELAYEEGIDRNLLARLEQGSREGAPWQAELLEPDGIAVSPGGERVVVADTGNHCIRELVGPMATVRTLAGQPGEKGTRDGFALQAQFRGPRDPVVLGERVYVVDGVLGERIRVIADGKVGTATTTAGPSWERVDTLRARGGTDPDLWILDSRRWILRFDTTTGVSSQRYEHARPDLVSFDVGPDGRLYLGDIAGRIFQLSPGEQEPVLLFANDAEELLPQGEADYFPFDFDRMALDTLVDLRYVPRYDGVLVQDEHQASKYGRKVPERIHLRLLSLGDRKIYPWVHPLVHGGGHMFHNQKTKALSGYLHLGSMALDPHSATLWYVERKRSRVLQLSDGLLGTAKLGHHKTPLAYGGLKDVFGREAGTDTMLHHHPERSAHRRLEALERDGPYFGLLLGSSMTSLTEVVGQYSMGRLMERELARTLGLRDGIRFDLVHRAFRGPKLAHIVQALESFIEHQSPVDAVFIETHSGRMYREFETQGDMAESVDRIRLAAARYRSLVVILDNDAMDGGKGDGLRKPDEQQYQFLDLCERAGFVVLRPNEQLLREAIDHAPWGNAPFKGGHASTWAMDITANTFARLAYPALREHLRGRRPALTRPPALTYARTKPLFGAFEEAGTAWASAAADVPVEAIQQRLALRHIQVLVDLGRVTDATLLTGEHLDSFVLGVLVQAIVRDPAGRLGNKVTVSLARFANYDEYGVGVLEGAKIVEERTYDRDELSAFLTMMSQRASR
ncbi:MAG: hypothetical protein AAF799_23615 [Myxococcota bacterium]